MSENGFSWPYAVVSIFVSVFFIFIYILSNDSILVNLLVVFFCFVIRALERHH